MKDKRKRHVLYRVISVTVALILVFSLCILPFSASAATIPGYTVNREFMPSSVYWTMSSSGEDLPYGQNGVTPTITEYGLSSRFYRYQFTEENTTLSADAILHFKFDLTGFNFRQYRDNYLRIDFLLFKTWLDHNVLNVIRFNIAGQNYAVGASDGVVTYADYGDYNLNPTDYSHVGFLIDLNKLSGYGSMTSIEIACHTPDSSFINTRQNWRIWISPLIYYGYSEKSVAEEEIYQGPDTGTVDELEQQESALRDQVDDNKQEFTNLINVPWSSLTGLKSGLLAIGNVFDSAFLRMPWLNNIFSISIAVGLCALILSLLAITFRKGGK